MDEIRQSPEHFLKEIEKEKQNLREWKRKVLILEIEKEDDEARTDAILERISELLERKEKLKK